MPPQDHQPSAIECANRDRDIAGLPALQIELHEVRGIVELQAHALSEAERRHAKLQSRIEELEEVNGNLIVAKLQMAHLANHDFLTRLA